MDKRTYDRQWYADHPEYRERQITLKTERRKRHVNMVREEKAKRGCEDCGEGDPKVLDLHHRDPATKKFTFGKSGNLSLSWPRIVEEINKCDVLCANCHRRRHYTNGV